ncbi:hypothetical protein SCHPADRAFT_234674 [Schizopora paradoxa]|uniref:Uncharacterized protein n=1 Tax=Schizopora paradoxa TaxID=27342 RepID=A0A0H2RWH1_9AGAM|nr:hypothetical protein SCHPADRAFT_234674 [Schizopora paradoxa]
MPLFSRLRALARSRPAPESSNFPSTTQHDTIQPWSIPQDEASVSTPQGPRFGVKIHPDINALLAEVESGEAVEDEPSSQLWMSSGDLSTEDRFSSFPMRETRPGASSDVEDQRGYFGEDNESPEDPVELEWVARRDDKGKGRAVDDVSDGISQAPSGSQRRWPTFGKERRRVIPDLRIFGRNPTTRHGIGDRTEEDSAGVARQSSSSTRLDNVYGQEASSSPSRRTTRSSWTYRRKSTTLSRRSSDGRSSLQPNASTSAVNTAIPTPPLSRAPSHSQRNLENRPDAFLEMPKAPRNDENAPLDAQQEVLYSPQAPTFGFPSPTSRPLSVIPSPDTSEFVTPASPPPLHSTPNNARTTEADVGLFDFNPPSSGPDRNFRFRGSNRQRQLTFGGASSTLNSLGPPSSSTFGKNPRSRALSDRPKASKIFSDTHSGGTMHVETELAETSRSQPFGNSTNLKLRSGSDPPKHRSRRRSAKRRRSAEWRSHTAAAGVTASPKEASNYGWPADVSRAILQLSLGEPAMATTTTLTREVQHTKTSSISCASRGQSAVLLPTSDKEAMYARPNREGVSQYNTFPASRRQSQMRTEVPPHALSFSFPILPSPSSSPSTASPAFNAGPASAPAEPTVSQPGPRQTSRSQGIGSKISETRGLGTGRTDEIGNGTGATREGKSKERDSGMIHHDLLDRAELESGEGGVRQDTSIALPPKETLRLVPSTSSKDQLVSARPTSLGSLDRLHSNSVDEPIATSTPPPKSDKSKGKRKAEETEDGSPPKSEGRKSSFAATSMRAGNEFACRLLFRLQAIHDAVPYPTTTLKELVPGQVAIALAPTLVHPCSKHPHRHLLQGLLLVLPMHDLHQ